MTGHNGNPLFLINYATQIISFIAVTPLVFLRIFARWKLQHALGIDDGMCVGCLISALDYANNQASCILGWVWPSQWSGFVLPFTNDFFDYFSFYSWGIAQVL